MDISAQVSISTRAYTSWREQVNDYPICIDLTLDSVPPAVLTVFVIALSVPNGFPFHGRPLGERPNSQGVFSKKSIQRLDFLGTALLLVSCIFLVTALEQGGVAYPWKSAFVRQLAHTPAVTAVNFFSFPFHELLNCAQSRVIRDLTLTQGSPGDHSLGYSRFVWHCIRVLGAPHYSQRTCNARAGLSMAICAESGNYGCAPVSDYRRFPNL